MQNYEPVVAIDGPSGSGKSTTAKLLAKNLGHLYIDTGAMFRALAVWFIEEKISESHLSVELQKINFEYAPKEDILVRLNGKDLTKTIREHWVSKSASKLSQNPEIRAYLLHLQREVVGKRFSVMEGRDIGTIVFPKAYCKIFLEASVEVRARRRFEELQRLGEKNLDFDKLLKDIEVRDEQDRNRTEAPLICAKDAQVISTDHQSILQVVHKIEKIVKERLKKITEDDIE